MSPLYDGDSRRSLSLDLGAATYVRFTDNLHIHSRVSAVTDEQTADKLCAILGGQRIYIPLDPKPNCRLARAIGLQAAIAVSKEIGRGEVIIPFAKYALREKIKAAANNLIRQGLRNPQIAAQLGVHIRTVQRIRRRLAGRGRP